MPDNRSLNYEKYISKGDTDAASAEEYTSHNTIRLGVEDMAKLLEKLNFVKALKDGLEIDAEES